MTYPELVGRGGGSGGRATVSAGVALAFGAADEDDAGRPSAGRAVVRGGAVGGAWLELVGLGAEVADAVEVGGSAG